MCSKQKVGTAFFMSIHVVGTTNVFRTEVGTAVFMAIHMVGTTNVFKTKSWNNCFYGYSCGGNHQCVQNKKLEHLFLCLFM